MSAAGGSPDLDLAVLIRYSGDCAFVAKVLATKTPKAVEEVYKKFEAPINDEINKLRQEAGQCLRTTAREFNYILEDSDKGVEVIDLD